MIDYILMLSVVFLNAALKALCDTVKDHFSTSVFRNKEPLFWNPNIAWKKAYIDNDPKKGKKKMSIFVFGKIIQFPFFHPLKDIWHLSNSIQISLWLTLPFIIKLEHTGFLLYVSAGVLYVAIFNMFYNVIFRKK